MLSIVWSLLPDNDWWALPVFLCELNPIKAHWRKSSWPFSFERLATFPPQADHVFVDLFLSVAAGGGGGGPCGQIPPTIDNRNYSSYLKQKMISYRNTVVKMIAERAGGEGSRLGLQRWPSEQDRLLECCHLCSDQNAGESGSLAATIVSRNRSSELCTEIRMLPQHSQSHVTIAIAMLAKTDVMHIIYSFSTDFSSEFKSYVYAYSRESGK